VGVDPERDDVGPGERRQDPPIVENLLGFWNRLVVGVVFAGFYIATFGPRQDWLPAIVSGVLGGAVVFLLLREFDERRKRRLRRQRQGAAGG
jgi:hypothetical protein